MKKPSRADLTIWGFITLFGIVAWFLDARPIDWFFLFVLGGVLFYFDEVTERLKQNQREQIEINREFIETDAQLNDRIQELRKTVN